MVRLMSPQFVVRYRKSNENDVKEAAGSPCVAASSVRFVGLKSVPQQYVLQVHRARQDGGVQPHGPGQPDSTASC